MNMKILIDGDDVVFANGHEVRGQIVKSEKWILCPTCRNKTHTKMRDDTVLLNFPLYCPKCKQETLITVQQQIITVIKEPDA